MNLKNTLKPIAALVCAAALSACHTDRERRQADIRPADDTVAVREDPPVTRLRPESDLGNPAVRSYQGTIPGDSNCTFVLYSYRHSGDGIFSLTIFDADNELSVAKGTVYTLRGENDATLWQCVTDDERRTFYFLLDPESDRIFWERNETACERSHPLERLRTEERGR